LSAETEPRSTRGVERAPKGVEVGRLVRATSRTLRPRAALGGEVDAASLVAFRILFGATMLFAVARYYAMGWVDDLWIAPEIHFPYVFGEHVGRLDPWLVHGLFGGIALGALGVMLGALTRLSTLLFFLCFTGLELLDRTTYLNHYYLISLLALLMLFMPLGASWSVDARGAGRPTLPRWALWTLRLQIGLVYFFAGLAKVRSDWLLEAEPLHTWLSRYGGLPMIGGAMESLELAYVMSWTGMLFDLSVFALLLWKRTRALAYVAVVVFHALTGMLFHIGIFPVVMVALTPIFFEPDWPRRVLRWIARRAGKPSATQPASSTREARGPASTRVTAMLVAWFVVQLVVPLRRLAYPGDTCWTEEGYRFAWQVMLIEKTGQVDFVVRDAEGETVFPAREVLTPLQLRMMTTQPDLILAFAHYLRDRWIDEGRGTPEVRAEAWVSLNGRRAQLLVDPETDLAQATPGVAHADWILPLEGGVVRESPWDASSSPATARSPESATRSGR